MANFVCMWVKCWNNNYDNKAFTTTNTAIDNGNLIFMGAKDVNESNNMDWSNKSMIKFIDSCLHFVPNEFCGFVLWLYGLFIHAKLRVYVRSWIIQSNIALHIKYWIEFGIVSSMAVGIELIESMRCRSTHSPIEFSNLCGCDGMSKILIKTHSNDKSIKSRFKSINTKRNNRNSW